MDFVLIVILALGFASLAHSLATEYNQHSIAEYASDDDAEWERFKTTHSKKYDLTEEEEKRRMIFMNKLEKIREHNAKFESGEVTYLQGINQFSDMTPDEIPKGLAPGRGDFESRGAVLFYQPPPNVTVPKKVDWRTKGVVTGVKNQEQCGSCWAFSATGALEGQVAIKTKKLVSLSEQDLVDCDFYDGGCYPGGDPSSAFAYIWKFGINSEESYPYEGKNSTCRFNKKDKVTTDKGWRQVKPTEEDLKVAVATVGPISVCIDATGFGTYAKGIYTTSACSSLSTFSDHCVLVVGYGTTEKGEDYWLVKNSWGKTFGEEGYIRMARNHNNMCGIANTATYPIV